MCTLPKTSKIEVGSKLITSEHSATFSTGHICVSILLPSLPLVLESTNGNLSQGCCVPRAQGLNRGRRVLTLVFEAKHPSLKFLGVVVTY